jgi:L-arabinonolactonase
MRPYDLRPCTSGARSAKPAIGMNTVRATLVHVVEVGNTLGESVLWDPIGQHVWWTDIQERLLYRYQPVKDILEKFELPERLGSFGFVESSDRIVAAFESGLAFYHPESAQLEWIARPEHAVGNVRFNDGRVDRMGRFWAGSMVEGPGEPTGKLYCLCRGITETHLRGVAIANGICFSPDGRHLYFADSPQFAIQRFDMDPVSGALSNRQIFAQTPPGAFPDGSNVDEEGHLWNAQWGASRVVRYAPDARVTGAIELPVTQPTCVAFGHVALDHLFVTTARQDLSAGALALQPKAGHLFIYKTNMKGNPEPRYCP